MLRQSIDSTRSTITTRQSKVANLKDNSKDLETRSALTWVKKILPFLKSKSGTTIRSEDEKTIEEVLVPLVDSDSSGNAHLQEFLTTENQYLSELLINYEKLDSHLSVLSFLAGGEQFQSFDLELINGLSKISKFFINGVENGIKLEYTSEERSLEILETSFHRFEVYQKICLAPPESLYWKLANDVKQRIDAYYKSEVDHYRFLDSQIENLDRLNSYGVFDRDTKCQFAKTFIELKLVSEEIQKGIIYNPNTYGLNHRLLELPEVFDHYSKLITSALDKFMRYKISIISISPTYELAQIDKLIILFKYNLAKPIDRLITFQHLLSYFETIQDIDQAQVALARFTVDGILREIIIKHGYEIKPSLQILM